MQTTFQKGAGKDEVVQYPVVDLSDIADDNRMVDLRVSTTCLEDDAVPPPPTGEQERLEENLVLQARADVTKGNWPVKYFEAIGLAHNPGEILMAKGIRMQDPDGAAQFVKMDRPYQLLDALLDYAQLHGIPYEPPEGDLEKLPYEAPMPSGKGVEFLHPNVHAIPCASLIIGPTMERTFRAKYRFGHMRPSERFGKWVEHYECPNHPEHPAGHGTFAGGCYAWFERCFPRANKKHLAEVKQACKMVAHFRDIAGMHYFSASDVGFKIGAGEI